MCGCERHWKPGAACTCTCPEHEAANEVSRAITDVQAERERQPGLGWTAEHDHRHGIHHLVALANQYAHKPGPDSEPGYYSRRRLVQAAALLVAAIEVMDRLQEERAVPG